ncbi:hypothetical protein M422DRAFT_252182 [Sphaerobolus stellatus SS14]|uniref:Uncharacterized protein n=1 Tax=Sphaerobolus stellatus (strain SS14) TaxID=990650 RepID=A0A0C9VC67_SPHS4|nr:hypothetical protein M422DRAFT_252182 [Sphaerobolus stellatus SS14]
MIISHQTPLSTERPNAAPIEIIGLGPGRTSTGTMSLSAGLELFGFGPCYHIMRVPNEQEAWRLWAEVIEGNDSPESFDQILQGYRSVVGSLVAVKPEEVYAAYPNAKFILIKIEKACDTKTTRDPSKWEKSIKKTVLPEYEIRKKDPEVDPRGMLRWARSYYDGYHKGRLSTQAKEAMEDHNNRIKKIIPAHQLLVYHVGEGWEPLANFLGVPVPQGPFPRLNESASYVEKVMLKATS